MEAFRLRTVVSLAANHGKSLICCNNVNQRPLLSCVPVAVVGVTRSAHTQTIFQNMTYISNDNVKLKADPKTMKLNQNIDKPLCIIMNWMMAKPNHVQKYAKLYLDHGFDVVSVTCTPWQLMWPAKGSQVVAKGLLRFIEANTQNPLVVHGFSVGAYVWAELLVHAVKNKQQYQPVLDRIASQVWDSGADIHEIPVGFPSAVFPKNKVLQELFRTYIKTHMKVFHNVATKHYMQATAVFHETPCRAPGLFLVSKTDLVGAEKRSRSVHDSWVRSGMKCNFKCWDKSPHVLHYIYHPEEYKQVLYSHLNQCGLLKS
uniref:Transmembrane protein 53 n=1 Tax=Heliothis virescens TaxID=7102 RepID=A0A2A4IXV0_HELVI